MSGLQRYANILNLKGLLSHFIRNRYNQTMYPPAKDNSRKITYHILYFKSSVWQKIMSCFD